MTAASTTRRPPALAALALGLLLPLGACTSGGDPAPTSSAGTDKGAPPAPEIPPAWPLTGVESDDVAARPALAVKVENAPQARPQAGLEDADMVWEAVVEGGITRFVAVYHSALPDAVEPVRSVRPMDPAIVAPLGGILACTGGQPPFLRAVEDAGVQSVVMDDGDPGFTRDPQRSAPHDVVGDPRAFLDQADDDRTAPPPAQLAHADAAGEGTASTDGKKASTLDVVLSPAQRTVWEWAGGSGDGGRWQRSDGSTPSVSAGGDRLTATNVLVLSAKVVDTKYKDPAGAPVPETKLVGSGEGLLATGGRTLEVQWSKETLDAPVELTRDGEEVELDPGTTWVELVPRDGGSWSTEP